jgi:hypothetical protein
MLPDEMHPIAKQNTVVYWLDIWVPQETPVERMRFQAVLKAGERWIVYPMEFRVAQAVVPKTGPVSWLAGPVTARADTFATPAGSERAESASIRHMIRRNAAQDRELARALGVTPPPVPKDLGAEGYLKVRDFLLAR